MEHDSFDYSCRILFDRVRGVIMHFCDIDSDGYGDWYPGFGSDSGSD